MSQFRDAYDEFRRFGAEVVGVSVDSPYAHRVWAQELGVEYPLVSDFNRTLGHDYDVVAPGSKYLANTFRRSVFVIDSEGVVRYTWYQPPTPALPTIAEVLAAVQALVTGS